MIAALTSFQMNLLAYSILIIGVIAIINLNWASVELFYKMFSKNSEEKTIQDPERLLEMEIQEEIARDNEGEDPLGPLQRILQGKKMR